MYFNHLLKAHPRIFGFLGETLAARYYIKAGYQVYRRNWRVPAGELDLIVYQGQQLVFCEIKTRHTPASFYDSPLHLLNHSKLLRLRRLADIFIAEQAEKLSRQKLRSYRIDVLGLCFRGGWPLSLKNYTVLLEEHAIDW